MGCSKCSGPTEGFKCDMCGEESDVHVEDHGCGGEHCMPKCQGCSEAQAKCTCEATQAEEPATESSTEPAAEESNDSKD